MNNNGRTIIVVDNDDIVREVLVELVRILRPGWRVLEAADGQSGLTAVTTHQPDIALVDLNMPIMDGDTMIRQLRAQSATKNITYILLTGEYDASERMAEIRPLCFAILQKPYTFSELESLFELFDQENPQPTL